MDIEDIALDFDVEITAEECAALKVPLSELLPQHLPNSVITEVSIKHYPASLRLQNQYTIVGYTYRVNCSCQHGPEQVIIGKTLADKWIAVKVPVAKPRLKANRM